MIVLGIGRVFSQTDENGNPVFNSEVISEEKFDNFGLTSMYYTIDNNIADKGSSVYVSEKPTLPEYLKFSRQLPSYAFLVHQENKVRYMIMLTAVIDGTKTTLSYHIVNPDNGKNVDLPCNVWGEISEKRADELKKLKIDQESNIIDLPNNGKLLLFNGIAYRIQPYDLLKEEVTKIAKHLISQQK